MKRLAKILLVLAILLPVAGCGYRFSGEGEGPLPGLKRIAIPVFENKTSEPELGAMFAGALRGEFMRRGDMAVVPVEQADAIFVGRITEIHTTAVAHLTSTETILSRLYLTVNIRCEDANTHKVIWQDPKFTYYKVFALNTESLGTTTPGASTENIVELEPVLDFSNRRLALQYLAQEMSVRIHDRFMSNF